MTDRVLFIDDEKNVLSAFQRLLRGEYDVVTALGGEEALKLVSLEAFAVVVCDMRMPVMDGIQTLKEIAAVSPLTTRVMLTGNADQETATRAINEGKIFRFLNKPCPDELMRETLKAAIRQYELETAEKTLLEKTLTGSVKMMMDVLSVAQPEAFGRAARMRQWAGVLAKELNIKNAWEINLAASLSPLGLIGIPSDIVAKVERHQKLSGAERDIYAQAPEIGYRLLSNIPRLSNVARIVLNQNRRFDAAGESSEAGGAGPSPEGAQILQVLTAMAQRSEGDIPDANAIAELSRQPGAYDPDVIAAARRCWGKGGASAHVIRRTEKSITLDTLRAGDRLVSDISLENGKLLLGAGLEVSTAQIERLRVLRRLEKVREPIIVARVDDAT